MTTGDSCRTAVNVADALAVPKPKRHRQVRLARLAGEYPWNEDEEVHSPRRQREGMAPGHTGPSIS